MEGLLRVSRGSGAGAGGAAATAGESGGAAGGVVTPERPPVFAWWSGEGEIGDGDGGESAGTDGGRDAERLGLAAGS